MKCPSCGFENEASSGFCRRCGATMSLSGAPPPGYAAPPPPPRQAPPPQGSGPIDLGGWISRGFTEVFSDFGGYLLLGLIVWIINYFTAGLLSGPLLAGALQVIRGKLRGETPKIDPGSVLSVGFAKFGPTFLLFFLIYLAMGVIYGIFMVLTLIFSLIPYIGVIFVLLLDLVFFVLGFAVGGWMTPFLAISLHFIMEENMEFMDAGKRAFEVLKENLMMYWVFGLVTGLIASLGIIACCVGIFVTAPVAYVMLSLMLENRFPKRR